MLKNYFATGFLLVGLLAGRAAQAQTDFRPGYLVRPAGDTVRGLVDYRGARRNALVCQFRAAAEAPVQVLAPSELRAYGVQGEVAYRVRATPQPDSAGQPRPARLFFLEVLADGVPATLYQRRVGSEEVRYYVQKAPAAPLKELTTTRQAVMNGALKYYQDIPVFRGVLSEQFADCPGMLLSLAKTELSPSSLGAAVRRYNACRQPNGPVTRAPKHRTQLAVELLLGAQASQLTFYGTYTPVDGKFSAGPTPEVGLGFSVGARALRNKLTFRIEAHYARQDYQDEYSSTATSVSGSPFGQTSPFAPAYTYQSHFRASYLRVPLLLRYAPFTGRVRPFIEAGATLSPLLSLTQESRTHTAATMAYGPWQPVYDTNNVRHVEQGLLAGVGMQLAGLAGHTCALLGRVESSDGFLETSGNFNKVARYHLFFALGLTKQR